MTEAHLPTVDGVGASCVVLPPGDWPRLIDFLVAHFGAIPHAEWHARMSAGAVLDARGCALAPDTPYPRPQKIYYYRSLPPEPHLPLMEEVVFQDEYLVVADKPHYLPVTPSGRYLQETLLVRLKRRLGIDTLAPVHRIDRDTAGLVLFTIQPNSRGAYHQPFLERKVKKQYEAIARWQPELKLPISRRSRLAQSAHFLQIEEVPGVPNSETHIDVLEVQGAWARYALQPVTGRKHQLRVHMNALGLPILYDQIYPVLTPEKQVLTAEDFAQPLQLLAKSIAFTDPITGAPREFHSARTLSFPPTGV